MPFRVWNNRVDNEILQNVSSQQGLHCLLGYKQRKWAEMQTGVKIVACAGLFVLIL